MWDTKNLPTELPDPPLGWGPVCFHTQRPLQTGQPPAHPQYLSWPFSGQAILDPYLEASVCPWNSLTGRGSTCGPGLFSITLTFGSHRKGTPISEIPKTKEILSGPIYPQNFHAQAPSGSEPQAVGRVRSSRTCPAPTTAVLGLQLDGWKRHWCSGPGQAPSSKIAVVFT